MRVFAARNFKQGEIVLRWDINKSLSKREYDKLSEEEKNYISFIDGKYTVMQEPEKFVNHSCSSNTIAKDYCDIAVKDIKKGDEITSDYSCGLPPGIEMECNCGEDNCKRIIKK